MSLGTSNFDSTGRKEYAGRMISSGYVEDASYRNSDVSKGYFCGSCKYMVGKERSATGYWCTERQFPDRPYGCCDFYKNPNWKEKHG